MDGAALPPLAPGSVLGGCRLLSELGRGGMATVWRAEQPELKREVAVKVLRPGLALDPRQADRFRREALAIARIDHPGIVKVHAVGAEHGRMWLVMEKIEGGTLAQALASSAAAPAPLTAERDVARLFAAIARAVAAAHERGVVHRDLKPSNVLLRRDGTPVVVDFGLAKGDGDLARSLTGEPVGTPWYMSPEQVEQGSAKVDARTDVWSLGVMLFEALSGARPFHGATTIALFDRIRHELPPLLRARAPACSTAAEAVVARALCRDRELRYPTAAALAEDLEALAEGLPVAARRGTRGGFARCMAALQAGQRYEWRSTASLLGRPLVHVHFARWRERAVARGWIAIGSRAVGVVAIGNVAVGLLAFGNLALGLVGALGPLALGGVAAGALALGGLAIGGVAIGAIAVGGLAVGYAAIGGKAIGWYALGGSVTAKHAISASASDPAAVSAFAPHLHWLDWLLPEARTLLED
ncbi:MAG: serine/threonine protein kinase [Planctomycetes bacterium]|nr:serine/threonine protein kinase [Planctomycetota bacterium]